MKRKKPPRKNRNAWRDTTRMTPNKKKGDYVFPGSHGVLGRFRCTVKPSDNQRIYFALGMAWSHERDRLRIQSLVNLVPGTRVITVRREKGKTTKDIGFDKRHIDADFQVRGGWKSIGARLAAELERTPNARITFLLDYFFFQPGYYHLCYGTVWLSSLCHEFLQRGVNEFILPYDSGKKAESDMQYMLAQGKIAGSFYPAILAPHPLILAQPVAAAENPLWVASSIIRGAMANLGDMSADNTWETETYLHPETPFVVVTATGN